MKKAVMFGAGNIGRGFIGLLLAQAGYEVCFADVNQVILDEINTRKYYTVHIVDSHCTDVEVHNISAVHSAAPELVDVIAESELVTTAVGLRILPRIASGIAAGIHARRISGETRPLNIIACENAIRASSQLKASVLEKLDAEDLDYAAKYVGFPDCVVDRIVPPFHCENNTDVTVERHCEWDVERKGICGEEPMINGMTIVDNLSAYLERKLFAFNGPHCICACLGCQLGYSTIRESIEDPAVLENVKGAMDECAEMLIKRHSFDRQEMTDYCAAVISRFRNPYLVDEPKRVAREPLRKLASDDRLIRPMVLADEYGLSTAFYAKGIAAALHYNNKEDEQSVKLQNMIAESGVLNALQEISGIAPDSKLAQQIAAEYQKA